VSGPTFTLIKGGREVKAVTPAVGPEDLVRGGRLVAYTLKNWGSGLYDAVYEISDGHKDNILYITRWDGHLAAQGFKNAVIVDPAAWPVRSSSLRLNRSLGLWLTVVRPQWESTKCS